MNLTPNATALKTATISPVPGLMAQVRGMDVALSGAPTAGHQGAVVLTVVAQNGTEANTTLDLTVRATNSYLDRMQELGARNYWSMSESTATVPALDQGSTPFNGTYVEPIVAMRDKVLRRGSLGAPHYQPTLVPDQGSMVAAAGSGNDVFQYLANGKSSTWMLWFHLDKYTTWNSLLSSYNANEMQGFINLGADALWWPNSTQQLSYPIGKNPGVTQFIAAVKDFSAKQFRVFLNGQWFTKAFTTEPAQTGGYAMRSPNHRYDGGGIHGWISDVAGFDRALTVAEIEAVYQDFKL